MRDTWKERDRGDRNLKLNTDPRPQWCMPPPEDLEVGDVDSDGVCACAIMCVHVCVCVCVCACMRVGEESMTRGSRATEGTFSFVPGLLLLLSFPLNFRLVLSRSLLSEGVSISLQPAWREGPL